MLIDTLLKQPKATQEEISLAIVEDCKVYGRDHYLFDMVMRVGKSRFSIDLFRYWRGLGTANRCLILVPQTANATDWLSKINTYNADLKDLIDVRCYAALKTIDLDEYDTIFADEADCMVGEKRAAELRTARPTHWVFMSGTWDSESRKFANELCPSNKEITIDLELAVAWGIIPKPKVTLVKCDLSNGEFVYNKFETKKKLPFRITYNEYVNKQKRYNYLTHYPSIVCKHDEYLTLINDEIDERKQRLVSEIDKHNRESEIKVNYNFECKGYTPDMLRLHNSWLNLTNKRKSFSAQGKMNSVLKLVNKFKKNKTRSIFFTNRVEHSESICEYAFSNKIRKKVVDLWIKEFNEGYINLISTCGMLDRGIDFYNVKHVVLCQLDGSTNAVFQKSGRGFLSAGIEIIVLFADEEGLKDAKYAKDFMRLFKREWVSVTNFEDFICLWEKKV